MMAIFILIAFSEFNTPLNMAIPCSVNAYGRYLAPPLPFKIKGEGSIFRFPDCFEVTNCDLKTRSFEPAKTCARRSSHSTEFSWNIKSVGIVLYSALQTD